MPLMLRPAGHTKQDIIKRRVHFLQRIFFETVASKCRKAAKRPLSAARLWVGHSLVDAESSTLPRVQCTRQKKRQDTGNGEL